MSTAAFFFSSAMVECFRFASMVFLETVQEIMELSRRA